MRVGVSGGGLQGCCIALSLAGRGVDVALFDRNDQLLSRAAVANEGKIHLGYMYANDPSYSTARVMMQGALAFAPFFARHLGLSKGSIAVSRPAAYVVHRDSQRTPEQVSQYLSTVHSLIREAADGRGDSYFGRNLSEVPRMWPAAQITCNLIRRSRWLHSIRLRSLLIRWRWLGRYETGYTLIGGSMFG